MESLRFETTGELVALAAELEARAAVRFRALAARLSGEGRGDLASLFRRLAEEEETHREKVLALVAGGDELPPVREDWLARLGLTEPADGSERVPPSLYECLARAVRSEDRAFAFYVSLAGYADSDEVRALAEVLAKEELEHAAVLRRARRAAYHRERARRDRWPVSPRDDTRRQFLAQAREAEAAFLGRLAPWTDRFPVLRAVRHVTLAAVGLSGDGGASSAGADLMGSRAPADGEILRAALDEAQAAFDFYDRTVTQATRPEVLLEAQRLSDMALARIRLLNAEISRGSEPEPA